MNDKSVYEMQPFQQPLFAYCFLLNQHKFISCFIFRLCLGGLSLHHNHTKKILAVAGLGVAAAALAVGLYMHMKKEK